MRFFVVSIIIVAAVGVAMAMALSVAMAAMMAMTTVSLEYICNSLGTILDHALKSVDSIHEGVAVDSDSFTLGGKSDNGDDEGSKEAHYENLFGFFVF